MNCHKKMYANLKSVNIASTFIQKYMYVKPLITKIHQYLKKSIFKLIIVITLQRYWKERIKQDKNNIYELYKLWDTVLNELIRKNSKGTKKERTVAAKLSLLSDNDRKDAISKYYEDCKGKYHANLVKCLAYRKMMEKKQKKLQSSKIANSMDTSSDSELSKKPKFNSMLTNEEITTMIMKLIS